MANTAYAVYGTLALAPGARAVQLDIIDGKAAHVRRKTVARPRQVLPADVAPAPASVPMGLKGRVLTAAAAALIACALAFVAFAPHVFRASALQASVSSQGTATVEVAAGDSLWSIAEEHPVEGFGTKDALALIRDWNDLAGSTLQPGMELVVPA